MSEQPNIRLESSLPKFWEEETSFNDVLYDWMERAPWLALSALAHGILIVIMMAIPWDLLHPEEVKEIQASIEQTPEEVWEEPPPEEPEVIEDLETEEPVLQDSEVDEEDVVEVESRRATRTSSRTLPSTRQRPSTT